MKKTRFALALILLLVAGLAVPIGVAGDEPDPVFIPVWIHNAEYHVYPEQVAVIGWGWAACNPGLVRMFVKAINFEVTFNDQGILTPADVDGLWSEVTLYDPQPDWPECVAGGPRAVARWRFELPTLEPGRYELRTWWWLDHPIIDGADYDGDGRPDQSTPEDFDNDTLIIVYFHDE